MHDRLEREWYRKGSGERPEDWADGFYIRELSLQCDFAFRAFGEMQQAYSKDPRHTSLLPLAHTILVFGANVSKILTAGGKAKPSARARANRIRNTLELQDADFARIRSARNFLEHFDERMDKYLREHKGMLVDRLILDHDPDEVELDDGRVMVPQCLQFLNTTTLELTLYNQKFSMTEILKVLQQVEKAASAWRAQRTESARKADSDIGVELRRPGGAVDAGL